MKHPFDQININSQLVTAELWQQHGSHRDKEGPTPTRTTEMDGLGNTTVNVSVLQVLNAIENAQADIKRRQTCLDSMCALIELDTTPVPPKAHISINSQCVWEDCDQDALYCPGHALEYAEAGILTEAVQAFRHALVRCGINGPSDMKKFVEATLAEYAHVATKPVKKVG